MDSPQFERHEVTLPQNLRLKAIQSGDTNLLNQLLPNSSSGEILEALVFANRDEFITSFDAILSSEAFGRIYIEGEIEQAMDSENFPKIREYKSVLEKALERGFTRNNICIPLVNTLSFLARKLADIESLQNFMNSSYFHNLSLRAFKDFFSKICALGQRSLIESFMQNERFREITPERLEYALSCAVANGHRDIVEIFMQNGPFRKIPSEKLGEALVWAAAYGYLDIVENFMRNERFREIPPEMLETAFTWSFLFGYFSIVETFMQNKRFNEIPSEKLGEALAGAAEKGYHDIVTTFILNERFREIPPEWLGEALAEAAEKGFYDIVTTFILNERFREIPFYYVTGIGVKLLLIGHKRHALLGLKILGELGKRALRASRIYAPDTDIDFNENAAS